MFSDTFAVGVLIDSVDLDITSDEIIYEADDFQSITATVTLAVNNQSTEFEGKLI